jgi:hypothetical protein
MGDLSAIVPQESATVKAIYEWHKRRGDAEPERGYLGASIIGHECDRFLWFTFRNCVRRDFSGRMYRLFETGNLEEDRFAAELRGIGCTVETRDTDGKQFEVSAVGGHFSGHMDGSVLGVPEAPKTWHVLEAKTHNDDSFRKLVKDGVKASKPMHYAQMMSYMGLTGMTRALYLAKNKNTDELHSERVRYDAAEFKRIMVRAERIIKAQQPLGRCSTRPDDWRCKMCDAADLCWGTGSVSLDLPAVSCKTCCHATPEVDGEGGKWSCAKFGALQECSCPHHLVLPGLITFAEPSDAGEDWIEFKNTKDGAVWRHGSDPSKGEWTTSELMRTPGPMVGHRAITAAKTAFGGTLLAVEPPASLIGRYPPEDCRLRWEGTADQADSLGEVLASLLRPEEPPADLPAPTETFEDETHRAEEYAGKFLLVVYKADNYAAIWEGVE